MIVLEVILSGLARGQYDSESGLKCSNEALITESPNNSFIPSPKRAGTDPNKSLMDN